ncbi:MAG: DUF1631 family protein [Pseudomarimonas sp.]
MLELSAMQAVCVDLRRLLQTHLMPRLGRALDEFDSKLFALASASRVASEEQRLLDALRELRRQRAAVEHGFVARLGQGLVHTPTAPARRSVTTPLSLYARDELEERLALSAIATSVAAHVHGDLRALNYRLAALVGATAFDDQSNPIGPLALVEGFRDAFLALDIGTDLRLQAYRKVHAHVLEGLEDCYQRCNQRLIAAGVLVELPVDHADGEASVIDSATPMSAAVPAASNDAVIAESIVASPGEPPKPAPFAPVSRPYPVPEEEPVGDMAELFRRMLTRRLAQGMPPAASLRGATESREISRERLLDATAALLQDANAKPGELKRRLLDLAQQQSPARVSLSAADEGTVDLVDALFQRMSQDSNVPTPLGRALTALRVPFLNAALRDQSLMNDPSHPARQLIDEFGDSARGWCATADPGQRLLRQMQLLQGKLQQAGETDAAGFQDALNEFREFAAAQRVQAEQAELRAIESTRSREALHQAQLDAQLTIESHLDNFSPSPWLRQLLSRHWSAYLVLVILRYGMVSDHYRQAISFADALLTGERDAVNPIHAASFRARRLELETQLRQGLATLAYSDQDIVRLCGELHTFILVGVSQFRASSAGIDAVPARMEDQPRPESHDPNAMRHLRGLRPGTWFELTPGAEEAERGRLSWISPLSGRWLLVNWAGRKLIDLPPERMAEDIGRGLARVISDASVLARAVDAVMSELTVAQPVGEERAGVHAEG